MYKRKISAGEQKEEEKRKVQKYLYSFNLLLDRWTESIALFWTEGEIIPYFFLANKNLKN